MRGMLYDGHVAHPFSVEVVAEDGQLALRFDDGSKQQVSASLLEWIGGPGASGRIGRSDWPGWRLTLAEPIDPAIEALLPPRSKGYGRWVDKIGLAPAVVAFGAIAAIIVAGGYAAPAALAPYIPERWERDLGAALIGDFGDERCAGAAGNQALVRMAERVAPGSTRSATPIQLTAVNYAIFNAAALPGGRIVLFKQMIIDTRAGDSLTGVLAHEIAHVRRRHVTQALIRELGIGAVIRLFAGNIGADAQQLVALSYTRKNEEEADRDAIAMLKAARIDPRPTADLFRKLARLEGDPDGTSYSTEFLASHPNSARRAASFARSYDPKIRYQPTLSEEDANALRTVCGTNQKRPRRTPAGNT